MPIVEVISDSDIKVINRGYNEYEAVNEIDETDLYRLREYFSSMTNGMVHLEIKTPSRDTCAWYSIDQKYIGQKQYEGSHINW